MNMSSTLNEVQINKQINKCKTGKIYYDNVDTGESICSFFITQQDHTKKLVSEEFQFFDSYEEYIMNYLTQIENETDDAPDMLTDKNTKFFFINSIII